MNAWIALRRPLLVAFVLGCSASLMTSGRLTLRLVLPAIIYWTFVPMCEIASLAVVARRRKIPFGRLIDRYFESHTVWLLWTLAFAAVWAFVPAPVVYAWTTFKPFWYSLAALAFAWAAYTDFGLLRDLLGESPAGATRDLAIQRLLCWTAALAIFVGTGGWQVAASTVGL